MTKTNKIKIAKYHVGQIIHHHLYEYRGVIVDVDAVYSAAPEWYEENAVSKPPKDEPWYHVLVHNAIHRAYIAECDIKLDSANEPIDHPEVGEYFSEYKDGFYLPLSEKN